MEILLLLIAAVLFLATVLASATAKAEPVMRIPQERVIDVTYDTFDFRFAEKRLSANYELPKAGCSAVRVLVNGKVYVGRNLDFYCSDTPAVIVHNNAGPIRTIGVGSGPDNLPVWTENYTLPDNLLRILPALCCDVMSEAGIYAETNIRCAEEQFHCVGTNPGKERRCTQLFMLTMLSQYSTIDEITEHLNDYDWYDLTKIGFQQSFFLTDRTGRSIIVEFAANECRWQESEYNANFYQNDEWYAKELLGCGELRISRELAYKPFVRTEKDVFTMMEQGAYNQFYNRTASVEYTLPEFLSEIGYNKVTAAADPEGAKAATMKKMDEFASYSWQERIAHRTWESVFITAANVTDGILNVHFSEHYGLSFTATFE